MPILELTLLQTKPPTLPTDPTILTSLQQVRALLASRVHPTHSRFYTPTSPSGEVYILGSWPSVTAHREFLSSPMKDEILGPQEDVLEFRWGVHVEMGEGEVPDATVLGILRVRGKDGERVVRRYRRAVEEEVAMKGKERTYGMFEGKRCDEDEGEPERVIITGWASEDEYEAFRERARGLDEELVGACEGMSFVLVRCLEA